MPQQRYEYRIESFQGVSFPDEGQDELNGIASEGWQLVERVDSGGTTFQFIFERPVE